MKSEHPLLSRLRSCKAPPAKIVDTDDNAIVLDLSTGSELQGRQIAALDVAELGAIIDDSMRQAQTGFAFGRYGEPRELYSNDNFVHAETGEPRTIHLGIDLFCVPDTPVFTPLDGTIEIVANNDSELNYGPLVVVRHSVADVGEFFTLYGHLSLATLERVRTGQKVSAGEQIASVGVPPTNGNWPPHLHIQVINDLLGLGRDFPGVACESDQDYWFNMSPSPAILFPECDAELLEYSS